MWGGSTHLFQGVKTGLGRETPSSVLAQDGGITPGVAAFRGGADLEAGAAAGSVNGRLIAKAWVLSGPWGTHLPSARTLFGRAAAGSAVGPSDSDCCPKPSSPLGGLQAKTHNQAKQQGKEGFTCNK